MLRLWHYDEYTLVVSMHLYQVRVEAQNKIDTIPLHPRAKRIETYSSPEWCPIPQSVSTQLCWRVVGWIDTLLFLSLYVSVVSTLDYQSLSRSLCSRGGRVDRHPSLSLSLRLFSFYIRLSESVSIPLLEGWLRRSTSFSLSLSMSL